MPSASLLTLPRPAAVSAVPVHAASRLAVTVPAVVSVDVQRWCLLAVGSLVVAGLLSLAVVVGRLPVLSRIIGDPLFFKRCLVVHVDLALVVWFYAFLAALIGLSAPAQRSRMRTAAYALAVTGVLAMLGGALARGAQPILANYVPVIAHPLFGFGLTAFFAGALLTFVHALATSAGPARGVLPDDTAIGVRMAAVAVAIAAATWVSARAGLPPGVDPFTRAEFLAWGPGHVLQVANACAMLSVWLWLLARITGTPVFSRRAARLAFGALVLPQAAMPLLTMRGTLNTLYHTGATQLMRWTIFPVILVVLATGLVHLRRHRNGRPLNHTADRVARVGFTASAALAVLGMVLGACIRSSTTLVPAHYHASLGAVTVAFMTAAYLICDAVRRGQGVAPLANGTWRAARRQLTVFGVGQTVFALGFALGGAYGLGRKAYAAEQHVRGAGELGGLLVMGAGGLVAVGGGLWFLFLVLREMRGWRRGASVSLPNLP